MINTNIDIVFQYLYFITRQYEPSIPNKKKIKQLIECIPFFLPTHKEQQLFFELIHKNSIVNYYEENEQMMLYGYIIYESYYKIKKIPYLDRKDYILHYDEIMFPKETHKNHWMYIGIFIVIICLYFIYAY